MSTSAPGPRVTGLETEFGLLCAPAWPSEAAKADLPDVERAAALIFRHRPVGYRSTNLFLPNGGRLYLDIGAHPEYATAECVRVRDLVAQDQAGREILADMAERAAAGLAQKGTSARFHLLANNTDSAGHTYGCHESYSVPRRLLDVRQVLLRRLRRPGGGAQDAELGLQAGDARSWGAGAHWPPFWTKPRTNSWASTARTSSIMSRTESSPWPRAGPAGAGVGSSSGAGSSWRLRDGWANSLMSALLTGWRMWSLLRWPAPGHRDAHP